MSDAVLAARLRVFTRPSSSSSSAALDGRERVDFLSASVSDSVVSNVARPSPLIARRLTLSAGLRQ